MVAAKTGKTGRSISSRIRCDCSLWSKRGKPKPLATDKARKSGWGSGQNEAAAVPTPEVAAATRLWASASYCPHFSGSLNSFTLSRDPCCCCSVAKTMRPHGLQRARLPCPSLPPGVCSNSCPLNKWCHPTTRASVIPFSSGPQSFPASRSFPASQLFTPGGQSIGAPALVSVLPINIQGWFLLGFVGLISLLSRRLSRVFSNTTIWKHQFFGTQPSLWSKSHLCTWLLEKSQLWPLSAKCCPCFLTCCLCLSQLFFQGASILISWLRSLSTVILEPKKIKCVTVSTFLPSVWHAIRMVSSAYMRLFIFPLAILIPACESSSPSILMMCSTYKSNKQTDSI